MKKLFIVAMLLTGMSVQAQESLTPAPSPKGEGSDYPNYSITEKQAREIASEFFFSRGYEGTEVRGYEDSLSVEGNLTPRSPLLAPRKTEPQLAYQKNAALYVFNDTESKGFVIVSGNEQGNPILGWSDNGPFDYENAPCALKVMLELYSLTPVPSPKGEGRNYHQTQNIDTKHTTPLSLGEGPEERLPLLTTQWNQTVPYNNQCPVSNGGKPEYGGRCPSGCVQTAMAQVINYYQWPARGRGLHTNTSENYEEQTRNLSQSVYDWENMLDTYNEGEYNDVQANAVATLMADIGCAMNATYRQSETDAMFEDKGAIQAAKFFRYKEIVLPHDETAIYWNSPISPLTEHLQEGHPVLCQIELQTGNAHLVVCDGYKIENEVYYYHINFGWGGQSDGYYSRDINSLFRGACNGIALVPSDNIVAEKDGVYCDIIDGEAVVMLADDTKTGNFLKVDIPETVEAEGNTYTVSSIYDYAFMDSRVTHLNIPGTVKRIQPKLFFKPNYFQWPLQSVTFANGVEEIGDSAFCNCVNLNSSLYFGDKLKRVGAFAFSGTKVNGVTFQGEGFVIGRNAFPNGLLWANGLDRATEIGSWAVVGDMEGIFTVRPGSVYADNAVRGKYDYVYIPNSVTEFNGMGVTGTAAYCAAKDNPAYSTANGTLYNKDRSRLIRQPEVRNWLQYSERTWALMPATVTAIDPHAFYNDVKCFTFPNSITKLDGILSQSPDLREVSCMSAIPPELTDAEELSEKLKNNVNSKLFVPLGSKSAYEQTEGWKDFHSIQECLFSDGHYWYHTYPEFQSASLIGRDATASFDGHAVIPASLNVNGVEYKVGSVQMGAFFSDNQVRTITLPSTISDISGWGGEEFIGCDRLQAINMDGANDTYHTTDGVLYKKDWGENVLLAYPAMLKGTSQTNVRIPAETQKIGMYSFANNLQEVIIPATVSRVERWAFYDCPDIQAVYCLGETPPSFDFSNSGEKMFLPNVCLNATLYVPQGCRNTYRAARGWNDFANVVEMDNQSTGIEDMDNNQYTITNNPDAVYDLQGRRLANGSWLLDNGYCKPGVYIVNGRKVVVR